jgi:5-methyltetrahydrofolate--homocysteine methyltransferase
MYSNAGLPNAMGGYDGTSFGMAKYNEEFFQNKWLNFLGCCCGRAN